MANRNTTLKWLQEEMSNKIVFDNEIIQSERVIRGIYGIFVCEDSKEYCAYVGRINNIYSPFFNGNDAHLVKLKKGQLVNCAIKSALQNENAKIKVIIILAFYFF